MKSKIKKRFLWSALIGFSFWLLAAYLFHFQLPSIVDQSDAEHFEENYQNSCAELEEELTHFFNLSEARETKEDKLELAQRLASNSDFNFFIYTRDTLTTWTSNAVPLPNIIDRQMFENDIVQLSNGWYKFEYLQEEDETYIASLRVKSQYQHENKDLVNHFSNSIAGDFNAELTLEKKGYPILNAEGNEVFYLLPSEELESDELMEFFIFSFYLISFIILIQLLINAFQKLFIRRPILLIIFPALIIVLRYFWLELGWLGPLRNFELFNPELLASSAYVPSLGDLIINIVIFYLLVHFLLKRTRNWFLVGKTKLKLVLFIVPLFLLSFFLAFEINNVFRRLIFDSQIPFDVAHLFDLNIYSFLSVTIIGTSFYTFFKLVQYIITQIKKNEFELNRLAFLWVITSAIYVLIDQTYYTNSLLTSFWPIILSAAILWFLYSEKKSKFIHVVSIVAYMAFYSAYMLHSYMNEKELLVRVNYADKIARDREFTVELDYHSLEKKMKKDSSLISNFYGDFNRSLLSEKLEIEHFHKLKQDYELSFYLFDSDSQSVADFRNYESKEYKRTTDIITESGVQSTESDNLYFIKDHSHKLSYLSNFPIEQNDSLYGYLVTEFRSKKFPDDIGLPSLLLGEGTGVFKQQEEYSFAKYLDGRLVNSRGDYTYPIFLADWQNGNDVFVGRDGFSHYLYKPDIGHVVVVSDKSASFLEVFTSFSYLLIIYGVLLLIPLGFNHYRSRISFKNIKLNVKIRFVLIGLTIITLIAFAFGAEEFVVGQYYTNNEGLIKEKMESVKLEVEDKLENEDVLDGRLSGYMDYILKKFSNVFVAEINIYDLNGNLLGSSQPKIYTKGLISKKMNTSSFIEMNNNESSEFIHQEHIGKLNYLSAYAPFFNKHGEKLAYLNVQYISKQNELENQISALLLAIFNIMVLMLAISTILAVAISNRLTRPLKYIQESLKNVQIGAKYKPIDYRGKDEIGELVLEYNKKVEELQENAEALARSERESAWREMAKQVAHEIKNPLTPMKLSIQHLKRSINLADDDSKEKLDRVSKSLIEQIDSLTQIANEFSNFAKMPKANESEIDLIEIVKNSSSIFSEYDEHSFNLDIEVEKDAMIWADKDLLLRVFNNLIKNAIQAIPVTEEGRIEVFMVEKGDDYLVTIRDNGKGIKDDEKEKIFVPYFTTKSTGTGLGLAMTKQIVESMNGEIWFETKLDVGTSFYVSFPKHILNS